MLYQLARPYLRGQPPFEFDVQTLCGLCGILPPRAQLHLARLCYFRRLLAHCPGIHWNSLAQVRNEPGTWLSLLQDSFAWFAKFSHRHFGLTSTSTWVDWITFVQMDGRWKGHLKRAAHSCVAYHQANAQTLIWQTCLRRAFITHGVGHSDQEKMPAPSRWKCSLCDHAFGSKRALAMHAVQIHGYQTVVRHYAYDGLCANCGKLFRVFVHIYVILMIVYSVFVPPFRLCLRIPWSS